MELELGRGGQVYFLHNRVDSIWPRAAMIQELVPSARIGVGHGQMGEAELEKTMLQFMRHEFDILVCTTIIENGLDIPLANTMVIENAERYGLSELYQLRGRVGRSNRRAYAYLLVPPDTELTEIARKRLAALKEFSDLGAGFKIAALDLELRGAGNLLGGEQHGQINSVGFDTYVRLLEETVRELKGEEIVPEIHSALNLGLDIRIPPDYIADENQRLRAYRQIANAADAAGPRARGKGTGGPIRPGARSGPQLAAVFRVEDPGRAAWRGSHRPPPHPGEYQIPCGDAGGSGPPDGHCGQDQGRAVHSRRRAAAAARWAVRGERSAALCIRKVGAVARVRPEAENPRAGGAYLRVRALIGTACPRAAHPLPGGTRPPAWPVLLNWMEVQLMFRRFVVL